MKKLLLLVPFILGVANINGCSKIEYKSDMEFMSPAYANANEFEVFLNGSLCKNIQGHIGTCALEVKSNQDLVIYSDPVGYPRKVQIICSDNINANYAYTLLEGVVLEHTIPYQKYYDQRVFNCSVVVQPLDRSTPTGYQASFRTFVVNYAYIPLERPTQQGDYVVLGEFAYYSKVNDVDYFKKTILKDIFASEIMVESELGRLTYYKKGEN